MGAEPVVGELEAEEEDESDKEEAELPDLARVGAWIEMLEEVRLIDNEGATGALAAGVVGVEEG